MTDPLSLAPGQRIGAMELDTKSKQLFLATKTEVSAYDYQLARTQARGSDWSRLPPAKQESGAFSKCTFKRITALCADSPAGRLSVADSGLGRIVCFDS